VAGFEHREDAERFLADLRERFAGFGLELHPEKTRLIEFGRFATQNREQRGEGKPGTFTFLGFTHYCGKRRKDGAFIVWRETAKKRMVAKLQAIKAELKHRRHEPIPSVGAWLRQVTSGYYQYHAVPGNLHRLQLFRWRLRWIWWRALSRRSQRSCVCMDRLNRLINKWVPVARVLHPYPMQRFDASHPRREPYA
jgi:RNA-directed DNA polymerase